MMITMMMMMMMMIPPPRLTTSLTHVALSAKVAFDQFWPPPPHPPKSRDMDSLLAQLSSNPVGEVQAHPSLKARLVSSFDCEKDITVLTT